METQICFLFTVMILTLKFSSLNTAPTTSAENLETTTINEELNNTNELYVIREVVYEVGILAEEDNTTQDNDESHEQQALTIYNSADDNLFNLSNIPFPIQTNISGQVVTGLAPINLGALQLPTTNETDPLQPENSAAPIPALISVTTNLSTSNPETGSQILQQLPPLLGFSQFH